MLMHRYPIIKRLLPLLLLLLLSAPLAIPAPLHLELCRAATGAPALAVAACQTTHRADPISQWRGDCGDCHHQPVGCSRLQHLFSATAKSGQPASRLFFRIPPPWNGLSDTLRGAAMATLPSTAPPELFPASAPQRTLRSIVIRC